MSTHNLCFGSKITNIGIPLDTLFHNIKVGFKGVYFSWTCFPDDGHVFWMKCNSEILTKIITTN